MHQSKARRCLLEMLIEFQAVDEEALKAVGTSQVRPGRFEVRLFQARKSDRQIDAAQRGNTGKFGARPDLVVLTSLKWDRQPL